jgi:hypothetical protein
VKRKIAVLFAAVVVLTGATAADCEHKKQKCEPGAIREDSYRAGRYWVCKPDGSGEKPVDGPTPKHPRKA